MSDWRDDDTAVSSSWSVRVGRLGAAWSRDPVALTDMCTNDAIRIGVGQADVGKEAIRARNERAANSSRKVLSYVPENQGLDFSGGWLGSRVAFLHDFVRRLAGCRR